MHINVIHPYVVTILDLEKEWEHSFSLFNYLEKNEEASVNALVSFFCSNEFSFLSFLCIYLCKTENHSVWELIGKIYSSFSCGLFYHGHTILTTLNDWISNQYCDAHIAQLAIISTKYANFQSCSFCSTLLLRHWFSVCDSILCGFSYIQSNELRLATILRWILLIIISFSSNSSCSIINKYFLLLKHRLYKKR